MKIKMSGSLDKKLKELNNLNKKENVSFNDLFNENFMKKYTNFNSISELLNKCNIHNQEDLETNIELLETEVKANTKFPSWEEMKQTAGKEHIKKKLDKILK